MIFKCEFQDKLRGGRLNGLSKTPHLLNSDKSTLFYCCLYFQSEETDGSLAENTRRKF